MNIAIRAEGGAGDVLLAHRFFPAIKEKYPDSDITLYIDSEGKTFQKEIIEYLYPDCYKDIRIIDKKKYKDFWIKSQFGNENQKGFIENVPDLIFKEMTSFDKFYDIHIDSLEWLNFDFNWAKYFNAIPTPYIKCKNDKYLISHLVSSTGTEHRIAESWWLDKLILDMDNLCKELNYKHVIISTKDTNDSYKCILDKTSNTSIFNGSLKEVCDLISNCAGLIGIDSAWRLVSHAFDKPTITISKNCKKRGEVPISHQLRWLINPKTTFGIYNSTDDIVNLFSKMLKNNIYKLFPELSYIDNIDNFIINRKYSVDLDRSILNG